jgi:hypothetical protein
MQQRGDGRREMIARGRTNMRPRQTDRTPLLPTPIACQSPDMRRNSGDMRDHGQKRCGAAHSIEIAMPFLTLALAVFMPTFVIGRFCRP